MPVGLGYHEIFFYFFIFLLNVAKRTLIKLHIETVTTTLFSWIFLSYIAPNNWRRQSTITATGKTAGSPGWQLVPRCFVIHNGTDHSYTLNQLWRRENGRA